MRYDILVKWVQYERKIDKLQRMIRSDDLYELRFGGGDSLYLCCSRQDSFAYWGSSAAESKTQRSIWQQIEKADLIKTSIADNDRIIRFDLRLRDIYQNTVDYALIFECIPPNPNLIFCRRDGEVFRILDARQQYSLADNPQRQILPGLIYQPPQTSYSPNLSASAPSLSIQTPEGTQCYEDVNLYLASYYDLVIKRNESDELQRRLIRDWHRILDKKQRKIAAQTRELRDAKLADKWYQYAEIIKYNLGSIKKGQTELISVNYYVADAAEVTIPLDPKVDAVRNMQGYIKKYHKARNGAAVIAKNLAESEAEVETIKGILIRIEAGEVVYPEAKSGRRSISQSISKLDKLLRVKIDQDWEIVVGRKASENDFVSTELGRPHDWWFHTRIYRGAHVLLRNFSKKEPPNWLVEMCCSLAAYYSKARFSQNVPVDYTQMRYVRKPRKSPLGFVTYSNHHTVFAHPLDLRSARDMIQGEK